jgi:hypothetical protein
MSDIIIYTIVPKPGAEGLAADDKGGAMLSKQAANDFVAKDPRYIVKPIIVDPEELRKDVLSRLSPVELLFFTFAIPRQNYTR